MIYCIQDLQINNIFNLTYACVVTYHCASYKRWTEWCLFEPGHYTDFPPPFKHTKAVFGQMLLALKIYSTRYVHYRFSALIASVRTQPKLSFPCDHAHSTHWARMRKSRAKRINFVFIARRINFFSRFANANVFSA